MTDKRSAGLLLFRRHEGAVEVLLGHMGGPYWAHKDARAWSIPKGEYGPDETPRDAARREFTEEIGLPPPDGPYLPLGEVRQSNGKLVTVWAVEADLDPALMVPGTFTLEWPPGSGRTEEFPELDRVAWCVPEVARNRLIAAQVTFVERLLAQLSG
ncbi:NUDIX domain-containing protein [Streptomyces sp. WAC06614]|uniref:NUDIX domain-containing protein n=1 Tax=Streptomyces sp. WAC06614 TaxID=2487416 RepID=UPI000F79AFF6|nr:NUDIX domain-containing protein [Streptomyces sp. WAC06614]RSS60661.1 NUDIX domain-containing protein [Streptomyces sp. WAC06614]